MMELQQGGRYAMFLRKSREDVEAEREGKFETLSKHRAVLMRLAESFGVHISWVYEEIVSGGDLEKREGAKQMLSDVRAGKWDGVFAFDLQRVTRGDMIDQGTVVLAFQLSGTLIITPGKMYNLRDELDGNYAEMEMLFGRMELARITRRLLAGKEEAVRQGQFIAARAPFGWDKAMLGRKKTLVPNADIKRVVSWYERIAALEATPHMIADELNDEGVPSPRGGMWDRTIVTRCIQNPVNKGYVTWNGSRMTDRLDEDGNKLKVREKGNGIVVKGLHAAAVSEELWQKANDAIEHRRTPAVKDSYPLRNPLATLLVCKHCGRAMTLTFNERRVERYTHSRVNRNECWQVGATVDNVVDELVYGLAGMLAEARSDVSDARRGAMLERLEGDLEEERRGVAVLFRLVERGLITEDEFAVRKRMADKRIEAVLGKMEEANVMGEKLRTATHLASVLEEAITGLRNRGETAEEVNDCLRSFVKRIEYEKNPDTKEISLGIYLI